MRGCGRAEGTNARKQKRHGTLCMCMYYRYFLLTAHLHTGKALGDDEALGRLGIG